MSFLAAERAVLDELLPGLDEALAAQPLMTWESRDSKALELFRDAGGCGLLVPAEHGGRGVDPVAAVRLQRAIGARSPSLAVATTMHHFSVASLAELSALGTGFEWAVLQAIAEQRWYLSSAFAEGNPSTNILAPRVQARPVDGGLLINGSKRPCSLTWSMDLMSASVAVVGEDDRSGRGEGNRLAIVLIPATDPGISRRPFWESFVLAGAESDEVVLTDVFVPDMMVFRPAEATMTDPIQGRGFLWFELLVAASYIGVASALVERVLQSGRGTAQDRVALAADLESAMAAVEAVAGCLPAEDDQAVERLLTRSLYVRYGVENAIARTAMAAAALAGGIAFVSAPDIAYLLAASRALAMHPPAVGPVSEALDRSLRGGRFTA
ncbi:acyl-CoA dehydrogenase family protein [Nakamurella multipartita]|uniref:Isobutylamine N-hydroxylase n=1 Tax=Nakamurella multipartita (strain ATCC 700099 / DSM 44233 / CIP 104796 / JCM 9543 / NBRC 105858 / Y-104) TaxID=479431 RepID=C8XBA3_NAKMY|nr:acyl-CoA dehydrogenase family protein [Nakamurella multipartita]ACV81395.1 isobutylamine N-hydroxylase [Nakamurella multipartita DSM 44233]